MNLRKSSDLFFFAVEGQNSGFIANYLMFLVQFTMSLEIVISENRISSEMLLQ